MPRRLDDLCPEPARLPKIPAQPLAPPLYTSSVYRCDDPAQADALLGGGLAGYVYQRDGHPNGDMLAEKFRELHGAPRGAVAGSGMAALAAVLTAQLQAGDHMVAARQLYGRSLQLVTSEAKRFGIECTLADVADPEAFRAACTAKTRLMLVETIANPLLRVADLAALAKIAHEAGALLVVDNTFATPYLCRPLEHGADLAFESGTKMLNGHGDAMCGLLAGAEAVWQRIPGAISCWGLAAAPFDCWLTLRGISSFHLRMERACRNAQAAAEFLAGEAAVERVDYPGLASHADHPLAARQFGGSFGNMVAFHLRGGRAAVEAFMRAAAELPFCPSLGDVSSTLSHPASTSHRRLTEAERAALGIHEGSLRLSVGTESPEFLISALRQGLGG